MPEKLRQKLRDIKIEGIRQRLHRHNPERFPAMRARFSALEILDVTLQAIYIPGITKALNSPSLLLRYLER